MGVGGVLECLFVVLCWLFLNEVDEVDRCIYVINWFFFCLVFGLFFLCFFVLLCVGVFFWI